MRLTAIVQKLRGLNAATSLNTMAFVLLALAIVFLSIKKDEAHSLLLSVEIGGNGPVQVYYDTGTGFSEKLSTTVAATAGQQALEFDVPSGQVQRIRIDPAAQTGVMLLREVNLGSAAKNRNLLAISAVTFSNDVDINVADDGFIFSFDDDNADPYVVFSLDEPINMVSQMPGDLPYLIFFMALALVSINLLRFQEIARLIPAFMAGSIIALALTMALLSPINSHPDELLHIADASYFRDAWMPPELTGDALSRSLGASPYGVSYLFEWNVVYFFATKFAMLLEILGIKYETGLRLFHITIFVGILLILVRIRADPLYLGLMFIVPQTWYVLSYFNGDAFPLLISLLAVVLGTQREGPIERFLSGTGRFSFYVFLFSASVGLLLISKKNYYFVVIFIVVWQLVRFLRFDRRMLFSCIFLLSILLIEVGFPSFRQSVVPTPAIVIFTIFMIVALLLSGQFAIQTWRSRQDYCAILKRGTLIYLLVLFVAMPWISVDFVRNGFGEQKASTVLNLMEENAAPAFRPSTLMNDPENTYPGLRLAAKGVPFEENISRWAQTSFNSFYAAFGYMEHFSAGRNYNGFAFLVIALISVGLLSRVRSESDWDKNLFAVVSLSGLVVFSSYTHSWTYDFQAQGRYLFSIIAIASPLFLVSVSHPSYRLFALALVLTGFVYSASIFITTGLGNLV